MKLQWLCRGANLSRDHSLKNPKSIHLSYLRVDQCRWKKIGQIISAATDCAVWALAKHEQEAFISHFSSISTIIISRSWISADIHSRSVNIVNVLHTCIQYIYNPARGSGQYRSFQTSCAYRLARGRFSARGPNDTHKLVWNDRFCPGPRVGL